MLGQNRLHGAHRRCCHPLARVREVRVVPRAVEHCHEPRSPRAIAPIEVLLERCGSQGTRRCRR